MAHKTITVSVYRFYNFVKSTHGSPFGLCSKHHLTAPVPSDCILEKLGDKNVGRVSITGSCDGRTP